MSESKHTFVTPRLTHARNVSLAVDAEGQALVAYLESVPATHVAYETSDRIVVADQAGKQRILDEARESFLFAPALATDTQGNFACVWPSGIDQFWALDIARGSTDLETAKPVITHQTPGQRYYNPQCLFDSKGQLWIVAERHANRASHMVALTVTNDKISSETVLTQTGNAYDPRIAIGADGSIAFAWTQWLDGRYQIGCRVLQNDELSASAYAPCGGSNAYYPDVAVTSDGSVALTWVTFDGKTKAYTHDEFRDIVTSEFRTHVKSFWFRQRQVRVALLRDGQWHQPSCCPDGIVQPWAGYTRPNVTALADGKFALLARDFRYIPDLSVKSVPCLWTGEGDTSCSPVFDAPHGSRNEPLAVASMGNSLWAVAVLDDRQLTSEFTYIPGTSRVAIRKINDAPAFACDWEPVQTQDQEQVESPTWPEDQANVTTPVETAAGKFILSFGQIHRHSELSMCVQEMNEGMDLHYRHAMDVTGEAFTSVTDHGMHMDEHDWRQVMKAANFYNRPGEFIAIPGEEWTPSTGRNAQGYGHQNLYHLDENQPMFSCDQQGENMPWMLHSKLSPEQTMMIPHHPACKGHPFDWTGFDERFVPVVEIVQDHRGSSERPGGEPYVPEEGSDDPSLYVYAALSRGQRFGFIGGGDHFGVCLAGTYVRDLSRAGVFEAFKARRTFATTGCKCILELQVNGEFMGGQVNLESSREARSVLSKVENAPQIKQMILVRSGKDIYTTQSSSLEYVDEESFDGELYYYVRVEFADGHFAWASPVWVAIGA